MSLSTNQSLSIEESTGENPTQSVARVKVVRGPGIYGVVNVPFEIIPEFAENSNDLSPIQGYVTFQDREVNLKQTGKTFSRTK